MSNQQPTLTPEGRDRLREELHHLETVNRPEVAQLLRSAKELGELSENPEYDDAMAQQAFVEGKIHEIKGILASARVVENEDVPYGEITIGSLVELKDPADGSTQEWTITGFVESDFAAGRISNESPLGSALMGRQPGDSVDVNTPDGINSYTIVSLRRQGEPRSARITAAKVKAAAKEEARKAEAAARKRSPKAKTTAKAKPAAKTAAKTTSAKPKPKVKAATKKATAKARSAAKSAAKTTSAKPKPKVKAAAKKTTAKTKAAAKPATKAATKKATAKLTGKRSSRASAAARAKSAPTSKKTARE